MSYSTTALDDLRKDNHFDFLGVPGDLPSERQKLRLLGMLPSGVVIFQAQSSGTKPVIIHTPITDVLAMISHGILRKREK